MTMSAEWADARYTSVGVHAAGVWIGENMTDSEVTVTFAADSALCLEGPADVVRKRLVRALYLLDHPASWEQPDEEEADDE